MRPPRARPAISHPQIGIAFKSFPLNDTDTGIWKHLIGRCVFAQDRESFWLYYDLMFSNEAPAVVKADSIADLLGLDAGALSACAARPETKEAVLADLREGQKRGAGGTPSFFFKGRMIEGYQTPEKMTFHRFLELRAPCVQEIALHLICNLSRCLLHLKTNRARFRLQL